MLPPFKEALSKICTFLCFWRSTCCATVSTSSLGRANSLDQQAENLLPNNTVSLTVNGNHVGAAATASAASVASRIESTTVEAAAAVPQNGSGTRQVLVISHRELVPGEPPKTARVLRLLSKRRRTGGQKRGNQVRPPPESNEPVPYSKG